MFLVKQNHFRFFSLSPIFFIFEEFLFLFFGGIYSTAFPTVLYQL